MATGSCLCGAVRYEINGELGQIQVCHCRQCRKAQGGPFAANIPVASENFSITQGEDELKGFESTTRQGKFRMFCGTCGSPMFSRLEFDPQFVRVRAGTIDEPVSSEIKHHQFVGYKADWFEIRDDYLQHDEFPPK